MWITTIIGLGVSFGEMTSVHVQLSYHHLNCLYIKYILKAPEAKDIGYHVHKTLEYQYTGTYIYILKFASK